MAADEARPLVAVLTRAIPVSDYSTDTSTRICREGETVADLIAWADRLCGGSCVMIRLEVTRDSGA